MLLASAWDLGDSRCSGTGLESPLLHELQCCEIHKSVETPDEVSPGSLPISVQRAATPAVRKDTFLYAALFLPCGETLPPPHPLRSPCIHSAHRAQSTSRPEHQPPYHGHAAVRDRQAGRLPSLGTLCTREPPAPPWKPPAPRKCHAEPRSQTPKPHGLSVRTAVQQRLGRGAVGGMCQAGLPWGRRAPFSEATTPGPRAAATQAVRPPEPPGRGAVSEETGSRRLGGCQPGGGRHATTVAQGG